VFFVLFVLFVAKKENQQLTAQNTTTAKKSGGHPPPAEMRTVARVPVRYPVDRSRKGESESSGAKCEKIPVPDFADFENSLQSATIASK
jgi:hypothetical protein